MDKKTAFSAKQVPNTMTLAVISHTQSHESLLFQSIFRGGKKIVQRGKEKHSNILFHDEAATRLPKSFFTAVHSELVVGVMLSLLALL